ncbi:MAG: 4-(cytidine 5'-diphospho)-2-C-methyl-D-erythritol kinase [Bacteroidales bacterium]|nr:4-(cytidine 5'-diphospho)-2-C-methyl-D-erythritol kinase [Bacteroidales bacterium]MBR4088703.1 4-(cytidine 5'-diphospho)-2-C-methyl-D-erythritol kinase [Bacteroidales bacterium]
MILYPNAKINLGLSVLQKREDGFHNLETLFYPVNVHDVLEIVEGKELRMCQYGIEYPGDPMDNLCIKAYRALAADFDIPPVEIHLFKKVPVGAGLGGGSSDAAFTLRALNEMFSLELSDEKLAAYAATLGSDCPFFVYNRPMLGTGRGEILEPVEVPALEGYEIKLVYPPYFVSTAAAYGGIIPRSRWPEMGWEADSRSVMDILSQPVETWKNSLVNDFEKTVFAKIPELAAYKEELYAQGAVYASMSGSGSAFFGIFRK